MAYQTIDGSPPMSLASGGNNVPPEIMQQIIAQQQAAQQAQQAAQIQAQQAQMAQQAALMPKGLSPNITQDMWNNASPDTQQRIKDMTAMQAMMAPKKVNPVMDGLGTALMIAGQGLSGKPFVNEFYNAQDARQKANMDNIATMMKSTGSNNIKSVFTIGDNGEIIPIGQVPKGSQVVPPASMQTPEQKSTMEAKTASLKDSTTRANKLKELNKVIDFFEKKIGEIPGGTGIKGRLQGLELGIEGMLQTNPKIAAYNASIEGLRSQIVRGLGEVGNLSEYEQKYASDLLPKITDNLETRKAKLDNFRDYIKEKLSISNVDNKEFQTFTVNGKVYNIPNDQVEEFKKDMGL